MTHQPARDETNASYRSTIQIAQQEGWKAAAQFLASQTVDPDNQLEHIASESCADFIILLPVTGDDNVLDICGGWGSTTAAFARICKHVFSLQTSAEKLAFTAVRCEQEELHNVSLINSDPGNIPLPPNTCQVVLLTEPLSCGPWLHAGPKPRDHQFQLLKSIHRVLAPGGCLYLNIDNRFSYRYLLGARVPPTNLRFISLLPRQLASFYVRRLQGVNYPGAEGSEREIDALLKQAGFSGIEPIFPIPGYKKFRFITDFKSTRITRFMISRLQLHSGFNCTSVIFARIAAALGMLRWSTPAISFIAFKD